MHDIVVNLTREALFLVLVASAPALFIALLIGVGISLFQAVTQLQEQTLAFVPKIIAVFIVLMLMLPWMISHIVRYGQMIFMNLPVWFG